MTLHVERFGIGPDVVLLHGWGLHGGVWRPLVPRLGERFRLHLVDLPGHGHSRGAAFEGLDAVADAVARCVPEGATVGGWSLGALVAMRLATRHPRLAARLAFVSATPCFVQRADWPHAMARETLDGFAEGLRLLPARTIRTFVNLNALGGPQARERMRELAALLAERGSPSEPSLRAGLDLLREADLRDEVATIDRPSVVIHGGRDALAPAGAGRWLAAALPFARLVEIPGAAHLPFASHADEVARAFEALHG